ncbi:MAG: rRNA maturation RNase YbeY [Candidatus Krumholzibacteriaceae bacterium]|jgi:probable rRNA maturation factor
MRLVIERTGRPATRAACARLSPILRALAARVPPGGSTVEVNWVGERTMSRLNRVYKRRRGIPEILTFPCAGGPDPASELPLGEIYLSWARVTRGARRRGVSKRSYAARLLVHGIFHLRLFRHDDERQAARMERAEARFLRGAIPKREVERLFA